MDKFGFPTNIKQIGKIDENIRVYIEDNVYTYLMELSESRDEECAAALVGRCMIIDGKKVLFINGAIQTLHTEMEKGIIKFTKESIEHIEEEKEKYFLGLEVVGWIISQPNYGNFLSTGYINYHKQNFTKPYQVLFVTDPVEKIHTFFNWNEEQTDIIESEGFFIYYDRNTQMKEYAEANKIIKYNYDDSVELRLLNDDSEYDDVEEIFADEYLEKADDKYNTISLTDNETKRVIQTINKLSNEKTPQRKPEKRTKRQKETMNQQNKIVNMLVMVSCMLFFVSVVLGAGMVKSDTKVAKLEQQIILMSKAYNELLGDSTPVFNNQDSSVEVMAQEPEISINDIIDGNTSEEVDISQIENNPNQQKNISSEAEEVDEDDKPETIQEETDTASKTSTYRVDAGDTLTSISIKFYGTKDRQVDIMKANGIEDPNKIYYGMLLKLP